MRIRASILVPALVLFQPNDLSEQPIVSMRTWANGRRGAKQGYVAVKCGTRFRSGRKEHTSLDQCISTSRHEVWWIEHAGASKASGRK
jgi:hypothetical protein